MAADDRRRRRFGPCQRALSYALGQLVDRGALGELPDLTEEVVRQRHAGPRRARLERATLVRRAFRAQGAQLETQEERDDEHAQKAGGDDAAAARGQGRQHGKPLRVRPGEKR